MKIESKNIAKGFDLLGPNPQKISFETRSTRSPVTINKKEEIKTILKTYHNNPPAGHYGFKKTVYRVKEDFV